MILNLMGSMPRHYSGEKPLKTQKNGYPGVGYTCGPEFIIPKTFKFYLL